MLVLTKTSSFMTQWVWCIEMKTFSSFDVDL